MQKVTKKNICHNLTLIIEHVLIARSKYEDKRKQHNLANPLEMLQKEDGKNGKEP